MVNGHDGDSLACLGMDGWMAGCYWLSSTKKTSTTKSLAKKNIPKTFQVATFFFAKVMLKNLSPPPLNSKQHSLQICMQPTSPYRGPKTLICFRNFTAKYPKKDAIWMFPKIGVVKPPKSSHFNRVFHYFHHPFWGVYHPYFWFNTHI